MLINKALLSCFFPENTKTFPLLPRRVRGSRIGPGTPSGHSSCNCLPDRLCDGAPTHPPDGRAGTSQHASQQRRRTQASRAETLTAASCTGTCGGSLVLTGAIPSPLVHQIRWSPLCGPSLSAFCALEHPGHGLRISSEWHRPALQVQQLISHDTVLWNPDPVSRRLPPCSDVISCSGFRKSDVFSRRGTAGQDTQFKKRARKCFLSTYFILRHKPTGSIPRAPPPSDGAAAR